MQWMFLYLHHFKLHWEIKNHVLRGCPEDSCRAPDVSPRWTRAPCVFLTLRKPPLPHLMVLTHLQGKKLTSRCLPRTWRPFLTRWARTPRNSSWLSFNGRIPSIIMGKFPQMTHQVWPLPRLSALKCTSTYRWRLWKIPQHWKARGPGDSQPETATTHILSFAVKRGRIATRCSGLQQRDQGWQPGLIPTGQSPEPRETLLETFGLMLPSRGPRLALSFRLSADLTNGIQSYL